MTIAAHINDVPKDITAVVIRKGGVLKAMTQGWIRVAGALKPFYLIASAALSDYVLLGRGNSASVITVTSNAVTAIMSGAVGTVSYAWSRTAADAQPWTITNPANATTTFSTAVNQGDFFNATFVCTMTDQAGQVVVSLPVAVNCGNTYYGGGFGSGGGPYQ